MPRPKPNKAARRFLSRPHSLSDSVRGQLVELLELGESANIGEVVDGVERTLGIYTGGAQHLDDNPRPADYVRTFKPISRDAKNLLDKLQSMGEYLGEQFSIRGADQDSIEQALISLLTVSGVVVRDFEGKPSKGARKNTALTEVIRRLRRIFRENYKGQRTERKQRGPFQSLPDWERRELEFVQTALRDARIIPEGYRELPRLFRDPRCTPS